MDANASAHKVQSLSDELEVKADVMEPNNTEATCLQVKRSMVDYAIVSRKAKPYIKSFMADFGVHWAPILGSAHDVLWALRALFGGGSLHVW